MPYQMSEIIICSTEEVKVGNNTSTLLILATGAPKGCALSPHLFSQITHNCVATHTSNSIIKFADV